MSVRIIAPSFLLVNTLDTKSLLFFRSVLKLCQ
nr:MAG TPA: hypothetical protein [Caudoviricetes sp.]